MGDMVEQGFAGQLEDVILEVLEVAQAGDFLHCLGIPENEIAKTEVPQDEFAQIYGHLLGILIDKAHLLSFDELSLLRFRGFHDQGDEFIALPNGFQKMYACQLVQNALMRETTVRDNTQCVVAISVIKFPCFFVRAREYYFSEFKASVAKARLC